MQNHAIIAQDMNAMVWPDLPQICWGRSRAGSNQGVSSCTVPSLAMELT